MEWRLLWRALRSLQFRSVCWEEGRYGSVSGLSSTAFTAIVDSGGGGGGKNQILFYYSHSCLHACIPFPRKIISSSYPGFYHCLRLWLSPIVCSLLYVLVVSLPYTLTVKPALQVRGAWLRGFALCMMACLSSVVSDWTWCSWEVSLSLLWSAFVIWLVCCMWTVTCISFAFPPLTYSIELHWCFVLPTHLDFFPVVNNSILGKFLS